MSAAEHLVVVRSADRATWSDLQLVFGTRGPASRCWCQRFKLAPKESFGSVPAEDRAHRLREQTDCDHPGAGRTSGLVGYLDDEAVGWCAVEPRPHYDGLVRVFRVPWLGRDEDRSDEGVWAVTCLLTRTGFRRQGVSRALARAAVEFARTGGARALEAYPIIKTAGILAEELHVGTVATFAGAGLREVARPTLRRVVMRIDF
jgi:GNAT superfamily N-acetyltransferase